MPPRSDTTATRKSRSGPTINGWKGFVRDQGLEELLEERMQWWMEENPEQQSYGSGTDSAKKQHGAYKTRKSDAKLQATLAVSLATIRQRPELASDITASQTGLGEDSHKVWQDIHDCRHSIASHGMEASKGRLAALESSLANLDHYRMKSLKAVFGRGNSVQHGSGRPVYDPACSVNDVSTTAPVSEKSIETFKQPTYAMLLSYARGDSGGIEAQQSSPCPSGDAGQQQSSVDLTPPAPFSIADGDSAVAYGAMAVEGSPGSADGQDTIMLPADHPLVSAPDPSWAAVCLDHPLMGLNPAWMLFADHVAPDGAVTIDNGSAPSSVVDSGASDVDMADDKRYEDFFNEVMDADAR